MTSARVGFQMVEQTATVLSPMPNSRPLAGRHSGRRGDWVVWSERTLLLLLILLFVAKGFVPAWKHLNTDFPNYYVGARLYRQGYSIERVYEWIWFQRQKDHLGVDQRLVGFIPLTLPSILPVMPLSSLPPLQAKHVWLLMNLVFLASTAALLKSSTKLKMQRVVLLTFLAVLPLHDSFLDGQMHILILLILTFSAWLYFKDSFFVSGLLLSIAAAIKIYPALFLIFFVWKKQWRAAIGLIVGLLGAAISSLSLFGWDACRLYAFEVLPRAVRGEVTDPYNVAWSSFTALLRRLFLYEPELNPSPVAHSPWLFALLQPAIHGLIFVAFMWAIGSKTEDRGRIKLEWATYSFLLLLLSSQPATYHFVALILTAVLVVDYLLASGQTIRAIVVVGLYALICGPRVQLHGIQATGWGNLLVFPRLAWMALLGGVLLWILIDLPPELISIRFNFRTSLLAASASITLVAVGFSSTLHHLTGQFSNYGTRVLTIPNSALAMDPVITSEGLFFTALVPKFPPTGTNTYAVHQLKGLSVISFAVSDDSFHPAAGIIGHPTWTEVATSSGSRIVRFSSSSKPDFTDDISLEVENGEQPIASPDGELLAYMRELKGRTSLWIRRASTTAGGEGTVGERQVAGPQYDVRDTAFFPDHQIVFSSRHAGRFHLYEANLVSGSVHEMKEPACSARYPAVSPDGKWIAFSCEQGGRWQVQVMNLQTGKQFQLTSAECNSVSPVWTLDSKELVYATDCGRGLGLTALARLSVFP
jgi:Glycosyltransferase family 87/WD40-like Beta Propeller Repeat